MTEEMTVKIKKRDFHRPMCKGDTFVQSGYLYKCIVADGHKGRYKLKCLGEMKVHRPRKGIFKALTAKIKRR